MSLTKRILFDKDPFYDEARRKLSESIADHCSQFTFRIARNRRNSDKSSRRHWDYLWPISVEIAAKELNAESIEINAGIHFRTAKEMEAVKSLAEHIWGDGTSRHRVIKRLGTTTKPLA